MGFVTDTFTQTFYTIQTALHKDIIRYDCASSLAGTPDTHTVHTPSHGHLIRVEWLMIEQAKKRWANRTYNILFSSHPSGCHSRELKRWKHKRSK